MNSHEKTTIISQQAAELVHTLYNKIDFAGNPNMAELQGVLLRVFKRLPTTETPEGLVNHLVNYINFTAYTDGYTFNDEQHQLIRQLTDIGNRAGINGAYRSNYGDPSQF